MTRPYTNQTLMRRVNQLEDRFRKAMEVIVAAHASLDAQNVKGGAWLLASAFLAEEKAYPTVLAKLPSYKRRPSYTKARTRMTEGG